MNVAGFDWELLLIQVGVLLLSISIHESAHAWSADRLGDPTARRLGRVSFNPLVHIDLVGTVLFPLLGFYLGGVVFGWAKPVPVNPAYLVSPRRDHALVAAAGPLSNLLLAGVCLMGFKVLQGTLGLYPLVAGQLLATLVLILQLGLVINVVLALFNLIPLPPLDGGWILAGLLPLSLGWVFDAVRPYGFLLLILLLYGGVFDSILTPVLRFVLFLAFQL